MDKRQSILRPADVMAAACLVVFTLLVFAASMARGRDYAKRVLCSVNLMKLHAAMSHYLADNEERYCSPLECLVDTDRLMAMGVPLSCQWHDARVSPQVDEKNAGVLWGYMQAPEVMVCETFRHYAKLYGANHPGHNPAIPIEPQYSYSQNAYLGYPRWGGALGVMREAEVASPDRTLVFAEETIWLIPGLAQWVLNDMTFMPRHGSDVSGDGDTIATYHGTTPERKDKGRGNAVFVDGHVELCDPWVRHEYEWGYLTESFYLSWPKGKVFTAEVPY